MNTHLAIALAFWSPAAARCASEKLGYSALLKCTGQPVRHAHLIESPVGLIDDVGPATIKKDQVACHDCTEGMDKIRRIMLAERCFLGDNKVSKKRVLDQVPQRGAGGALV